MQPAAAPASHAPLAPAGRRCGAATARAGDARTAAAGPPTSPPLPYGPRRPGVSGTAGPVGTATAPGPTATQAPQRGTAGTTGGATVSRSHVVHANAPCDPARRADTGDAATASSRLCTADGGGHVRARTRRVGSVC